jgi:hypothetical protein
VEKLMPFLLLETPKITNMKVQWLPVIILPVFAFCRQPATPVQHRDSNITAFSKLIDIPVPEGYIRLQATDKSFSTWLRNIKIKKDPQVYLYNGQLKRNQSAQYAVLDLPVGNKDLQQCADAVMRMRAEYLYLYNRHGEISFADNNGKKYNCPGAADRRHFEKYLETVFAYCGTASLEKQLRPVKIFGDVVPGDVLIKGGFPGHAVMVMDVARDSSGKKIYLLAQSYMPAQDIHVLKNPMNKSLSPWYFAEEDNSMIYSPEWTFSPKELRRW